MPSFRDRAGDLWEVPFTFLQARRIKSVLGIDLAQIVESKAAKSDLEKVTGDFEQMINILFLCCEAQAKERGLSDEDFASRLDLGVFEDALDAFMQSFVDFFLKGPTKERGKALMAKRAGLIGRRVDAEREKAVKKLESFDWGSASPESAE